MKINILKYFFMVGVFFFVATFSALAVSTPYTITTDSGGTISFPYKINFTEAELKLLKSLDSLTLQKLAKTAEQIQEKNIQATETNSVQSSNSGGEVVTYSNSQSSQTPYYNSATGQYQSKPTSGSGSGLDQQSSNASGGSLSNPYLGSSAQSQSSGGQTQSSVGNQSNVDQALGGGSVDMSNLSIDPMCGAPQYGVNLGGSCPNMQDATEKLKKTAALACSAIHKKITSVSVVRSISCAKGKGAGSASYHTKGMAIDISHASLTSAEKQKVFEVFKKSGFEGYGCYGANSHVHLDHGPARRWGPSGSGSSWDPNKCPQELFLAGYKR